MKKEVQKISTVKQANKEQKTLAFFIPCFGKTRDILERTLESCKNALKLTSKIEIIFVYKNSEKYNYDWVKKEYPMFKVFGPIVPQEGKKIAKIKVAFANQNSKYWYPLDADDEVNIDDLLEVISFLDKNNLDIVYCNTIKTTLESLDAKRIYFGKNYSKGKIIRTTNYNTLYSTSVTKKYIDQNILDEVAWSDLLLTLRTYTFTSNIGAMNLSLIRYLRYFDSSSKLANLAKSNYEKISYIAMKTLFDFDFENQTKQNKKIISKSYLLIILGYWSATAFFKTKYDKKMVKKLIKEKKKTIIPLHLFWIRCVNFLSPIFRGLAGWVQRTLAKLGF